MKTRSHSWFIALALLALATINSQLSTAFAQGTAFNYEGQLQQGGSPANGLYDFQFSLSNAPSGGSQVGSTVTALALGVTNGLFATNLDFGAVFTGNPTWLAISVRSNGVASYTPLIPLQQLLPVPYAIFANTAGNLSGTIASANLSGTYGSAVTLNNAGNNFTGNGAGLTGIVSNGIAGGQVVKSVNGVRDAVTLAEGANITITPSGNTLTIASTGGGSSGWSLTGNAGTAPGTDFVGTTDNQPLEMHVNNLRALRLEPATSGDGAPNVIGGTQSNFVALGVVGAAIAGGGATNYTGYNSVALSNQIAADFGAIAGGSGNNIQASSTWSAIGGGGWNTISNTAAFSSIGGGLSNIVSASASGGVIAGGLRNIISAVASGVTIGGGAANNATGLYATIPGGIGNVAGTYAFAAGTLARATNTGAFVWADDNYNSYPFYSISTNEFAARAAGGFRFVAGLDGSGNPNAGVYLAPGATSWLSLGSGNSNGSISSHISASEYAVVGGGQYNTIQTGASYATLAGGSGNLIKSSSAGATIGGGEANTATGPEATVAGGNDNTAAGTVNGGATVGGGLGNYAQADYATVAGGNQSSAYAKGATISGGEGHSNGGIDSTICGGINNVIGSGSSYATIVGGYVNGGIGSYAVIAGGAYNSTDLSYSMVGAGYGNQGDGQGSFIGAGYLNKTRDNYETLGGGFENEIASGDTNAFIGGGEINNILLNSPNAVITGGSNNATLNNSACATIPGGMGNSATNYAFAAGSLAQATNTGTFVWADNYGANSQFGSIVSNEFAARATGGVRFVSGLDGSGHPNAGVYLAPGASTWTPFAGGDSTVASFAFIGGGQFNSIYSAADHATIGGGTNNQIQGIASSATIGGGDGNIIQTNTDHGTIAGGLGNMIATLAFKGFIGGGEGNTVSGDHAAVMAGMHNAATASMAGVGGGEGNTASGDHSSIGGGLTAR